MPRRLFAFVWLFTAVTASAQADNWPQFRGPNASGRPERNLPLPAEIGPTQNVVWKTELPPGHSSPVIWGNHIFLTAVRDKGEVKQLVTIGLDRTTGKQLWEAEAPHEKLEEIHTIGSHAQASPVTDGERVVSFFGSSGLYCYDLNGKLLWSIKMGPFNNGFGAGSSPIIVDDAVILSQDHDSDSFLLKLNKKTGEEMWRTDRSEFPRNYCTPVVWTVDGKKQIVVAATLRVIGYDFESGKEVWTVRGIARAVCTTPTIGPDNTLYVSSWAAGGDSGERITITPFDTKIKEVDKNGDQLVSLDELAKEDPYHPRFPQVDRDKSQTITREEYEYFRSLFEKGENNIVAVRPGGSGEITATHVSWKHTKQLPFCASPVLYDGTLFTIKDGGILTSINSVSGKPFKQGRVTATNEYYSSPIAADGKVYLLNDEGKLSVVSAEASWTTLHTADFAEPTHATPAIADGRVYLRTASKLYCFAKP